ncbi:ROK family protein [Subtercola frigoramans]|uniref:NBD/HSP70 family sugar kinase n=1 Tax=Subtercola frigoramans TaxID=120298 RepID=A0ABS2L225_9MICO|nr:ROK family protein [Subtercola frigoramans]MBM7471122.1 putative NBD/HSP70 family sugar kinase [Subtercola frigoramans]
MNSPDNVVERGDPSVLRRMNAARTLKVLYLSRRLTMAQLQAQTSISRRTLELILVELVDLGWVEEVLPVVQGERPVGRPAKSYAFVPSAGCLVAIQLDIENVLVSLTDLTGEQIAETSTALDARLGREARLQVVVDAVDDLLGRAGADRSAVLALTVATPGIVHDDGAVDLPMSIPDWSGFSIATSLETSFATAISVENDAKLAALGELAHLESPVKNFLWLRVDGVRVGMGLVIDGKLYRGHDGSAGEVVWATGLEIHEPVKSHIMGALAKPGTPEHAAALQLADDARAGDPEALAAVRELAVSLVPGLTTLSWIIAPEEIVIGGSLNLIADLLVPAINTELSAGLHSVPTRVVRSRLGERAIVAGATQRSLELLAVHLFGRHRTPSAPGRGGSSASGTQQSQPSLVASGRSA